MKILDWYKLSNFSFMSTNDVKQRIIKFNNAWIWYEIKDLKPKELIYNFLILDKNQKKYKLSRYNVLYTKKEKEKENFSTFIKKYNIFETFWNKNFSYISWKDNVFNFDQLFFPIYFNNNKELNKIKENNFSLYKSNNFFLFWWKIIKKIEEEKIWIFYDNDKNINKKINIKWYNFYMNEILFQTDFFVKLLDFKKFWLFDNIKNINNLIKLENYIILKNNDEWRILIDFNNEKKYIYEKLEKTINYFFSLDEWKKIIKYISSNTKYEKILESFLDKNLNRYYISNEKENDFKILLLEILNLFNTNFSEKITIKTLISYLKINELLSKFILEKWFDFLNYLNEILNKTINLLIENVELNGKKKIKIDENKIIEIQKTINNIFKSNILIKNPNHFDNEKVNLENYYWKTHKINITIENTINNISEENKDKILNKSIKNKTELLKVFSLLNDETLNILKNNWNNWNNWINVIKKLTIFDKLIYKFSKKFNETIIWLEWYLFDFFEDLIESLKDIEKNKWKYEINFINNIYFDKVFDNETGKKLFHYFFFERLTSYFKDDLKTISKEVNKIDSNILIDKTQSFEILSEKYKNENLLDVNNFIKLIKEQKINIENNKYWILLDEDKNKIINYLNKIIKLFSKITENENIEIDWLNNIEDDDILKYEEKTYLPEYKITMLSNELFDNDTEKEEFFKSYEKYKNRFKDEDDFILRYFMFKWFYKRILEIEKTTKWKIKFDEFKEFMIKSPKKYLKYYETLEQQIKDWTVDITKVKETIFDYLDEDQLNFIKKYENIEVNFDLQNQKFLTFKDYIQQLEYEYLTITYLWFSWYFNIVMDFINYAKINNIWVWPWRWSAWWVLVSFCLSIIDVNPIRYWLLFERMLHLYKAKWDFPDIDVDFDSEWRSEIFKYVRNKYWEDRVSHVWSFKDSRIKSEFKNFTTNLWIEFADINKISWLFINDEKFNQKKLLEINKFYEKWVDFEWDQISKDLLKKYKDKLENVFKSLKYFLWLPAWVWIHACWIIISSVPIDTLSASRYQSDIDLRIQWFDKKESEKYWFVKFDFLWLSNMSIIKQTIKTILWNNKNIREKYGIVLKEKSNDEWEQLNWLKMYYDILNTIWTQFWTDEYKKEKEVFNNIFKLWVTWWVFQFESNWMRWVLREISPDSILELSDINAMFRPWPLANIPIYVETKFWKKRDIFPKKLINELIEKYWRKKVIDSLSFYSKIINFVTLKTKNLLVYQEQIMFFFWLMWLPYDKADKIRKILSKIKKWMYTFEDLAPLLKAAREKLKEKWYILELFEWYLENVITPFSEYSFNFSHAFAYCIVWYISAYLKYYYPSEFYTALLKYKSDPDNVIKITSEMSLMWIKLISPDINYSQKISILNSNNC